MGLSDEKAQPVGRDILSRRLDEDYFQVSGLQRLTGSSPKDFDRVILKELIDNALDACEAAGVDPEIRVGVERRGEVTVLSVGDNGSGLSREDVEKMIDFDRLASSHHYLKEPSRGMIGFAWKIILGAVSTLREVKGLEPKASVKVVSRGFRYELSPRWSHDTGPVVDMSCSPDESVPEGSMVAVELDHVPWFSSKTCTWSWLRAMRFITHVPVFGTPMEEGSASSRRWPEEREGLQGEYPLFHAAGVRV